MMSLNLPPFVALDAPTLGLFMATCGLVYAIHYYLVVARSKKQEEPTQEKLSPSPANFRRAMTSIGRFSLLSQTERNPSIISFFMGIAIKKGQPELTPEQFGQLWKDRVMTRHERFRFRVLDGNYFEEFQEPSMSHYIVNPEHPVVHHDEFASRITNCLTSELDVSERLWEVEISTGPLGSSGTIRPELCQELQKDYDRETVILFRNHHVLCDGVSLSVATADGCDQAKELREEVEREMKNKTGKQKSGIQRLQRQFLSVIQLFYFYVVGSMVAIALQLWRMAVSVNPFLEIMQKSNIPAGERVTTWRHVASLQQVKQIAKTLSNNATVNDVMVACITAAIQKQLQEHQQVLKIHSAIPSHINVVVPVHLTGGVLLPGQTLGNKIGAFVTAIPLKVGKFVGETGACRLRRVSKALAEGKCTPAALVALCVAKFFSYTPTLVANIAMKHGSAHSVVAISNVKGFPFEIKWGGHEMKALFAFVPLPPGIPIGIVVSSYNGNVVFTVEAEKQAVPNAVLFADWIMEEYDALKAEAQVKDKDASM